MLNTLQTTILRPHLPALLSTITRTMSSTKESFLTPLAQQPIGSYSQAFKAGHTVYLSGQAGYSVSAGKLMLDSFEAQTEQVFSNLKAVAEASGGTLDHIVKLNVFITDFKNFPTVNKVMEQLFQKPYPARSTIGVASLPMGVDIEVEGIMYLPPTNQSKS